MCKENESKVIGVYVLKNTESMAPGSIVFKNTDGTETTIEAAPNGKIIAYTDTPVIPSYSDKYMKMLEQ